MRTYFLISIPSASNITDLSIDLSGKNAHFLNVLNGHPLGNELRHTAEGNSHKIGNYSSIHASTQILIPTCTFLPMLSLTPGGST